MICISNIRSVTVENCKSIKKIDHDNMTSCVVYWRQQAICVISLTKILYTE